MDLEEKTLDPAVPERCEVCGAQLIPSEQQAVLETGSAPLCSIHAVDIGPLEGEADAAGDLPA